MAVRYNYSVSNIIKDWRERKSHKSYAIELGKKHGVPPAVIHNVIYQHRKRKANSDARYRYGITHTKPKKAKSNFWFLQNHVTFAGANFENKNLTII